ncbi:four helix bundle protein [Fulvivirga sedimenti]|uniref:Four helix bundle protein n=1 Tax=Fulvivirga sedimenti TaxID=2879465 RepID=A0A9X1KUG7_9BACT|nr:four helix bundle protein [Fulvivirga sedimenti]MCA6073488.1 four helix bundle protein [Fulvivirga sedimenti]
MIQDKSLVGIKAKEFAIAAVRVYKNQLLTKNEFIMSKQFLRSSTSIGANISEATGSYSRKEFSNKMSIAYKEARESLYWLDLLYETGYITQNDFNELQEILVQINKMLFAILRSTHFGRAEKSTTDY